MSIDPIHHPQPLPFNEPLTNDEKHILEEYIRQYREGFTSGFILGAGLASMVALVMLGLKPTSSRV
jgi:hypothetical protein